MKDEDAVAKGEGEEHDEQQDNHQQLRSDGIDLDAASAPSHICTTPHVPSLLIVRAAWLTMESRHEADEPELETLIRHRHAPTGDDSHSLSASTPGSLVVTTACTYCLRIGVGVRERRKRLAAVIISSRSDALGSLRLN